MANYNRNQGDQYDSNQDWDQNRRRSNYDDDNRNRQNYGNMNSDSDWDQNRGGRGGSDYRNQGGFGDMRNAQYGDIYHGNVERRERETDRAQGGRENIYRERDREGLGNRDYGSWNRGRENDRDWNSNQYGRRNFGSYNEGNYGRENRDYGMNRGREDRNWWDKTKDEVSSWFGDDDAEHRRSRDRNMSGGGEHRGKGPKGYQRSDDRIREDIHDRLYEDPHVDASDIEVKVENGEVTLTGTVANRDQKRRAEDIAEGVTGVRNVENRVRVNQDNNFRNSGYNMSGAQAQNTQNSNANSNTGKSYTGTTSNVGNIGTESGTTNEIIRDTGNMKKNS